MKIWKLTIAMAAACFAGGLWQATAQEIAEPEMLHVHFIYYPQATGGVRVAKDVESLAFPNDTSHITLPKGLTKLHTLSVHANNHADPLHALQSLRLPKDVGKDADWPFQLWVEGLNAEFTLRIHEDMGRFLVNELRIPAAKDLIRNREPNNDGVFRIPIRAYSDAIGGSNDPRFTIEVHGVAARIWLNRQEGGVEIVWDRGQLQSAPTINGPWTDITFDDTRRLFIRSSSPAEFFRVKPE